MERLKRTFSMRKKRDPNIESNKPHHWQEDERKVREGSCSFQVKVWWSIKLVGYCLQTLPALFGIISADVANGFSRTVFYTNVLLVIVYLLILVWYW